MTDDPLIVYDDLRACGYCARGSRRWFERYGLDFRDFLKHGVLASVLERTGDGAALRVTAKKREKQRGK